MLWRAVVTSTGSKPLPFAAIDDALAVLLEERPAGDREHAVRLVEPDDGAHPLSRLHERPGILRE